MVSHEKIYRQLDGKRFLDGWEKLQSSGLCMWFLKRTSLFLFVFISLSIVHEYLLHIIWLGIVGKYRRSDWERKMSASIIFFFINAI